MSYFGKNIRKIRTVKKLSQSAFAEIFDLTRASIGAYEEGRSEARIDTIIQIAHYYGISVDQLVAKELTLNEIFHLDRIHRKINSRHTGNESPNGKEDTAVIKNLKEGVAIRYVPASVTNEYIKRCQNKLFLTKLPTIKLPHKFQTISRAFEHTGCDLCNSSLPIVVGDILIGAHINKSIWNTIEPNDLYIVVTNEKIITGYLFAQDNILLFTNKKTLDSGLQKLNLDTIQEIWQVTGIYSTKMKQDTNIQQRVTKLEQVVDALTSTIHGLQNKKS